MKKLFRILWLLLIAALLFLAFAVFIRSGRNDFFVHRSYEYERSENQSNSFEGLLLAQPNIKNSDDLVRFVNHAWENGWGYVWGTFGCVLDEATLSDRLSRYPSALEPRNEFIRENWLGWRAADCSGLIKAYLWYEPGVGINYGANGYPDVDADTMFRNASESGSIETIPEIPGIALWCQGHIGIYIGDGIVVEAMGTEYGVVKTELHSYTGSRWTHWLKLEGIEYP